MYACGYALLLDGYEHDCVHFRLCNCVCEYGDYHCDCAYVTTSANASLLNNFEIVATSLIALLIFKGAIGKRMWIAISLITLSSLILSVEDLSSFSFSIGSIFVIIACLCWGSENNCTRMLSLKDPLQIVVVKGFGSGVMSLIIALTLKQYSTNLLYLSMALLLGFVSYGLSIYLYIIAQRELGAARTSAYYAVAPFIGVLLSIIIFGQQITISFIIALTIMIIGAYFAAFEHHKHSHSHKEATHVVSPIIKQTGAATSRIIIPMI